MLQPDPNTNLGTQVHAALRTQIVDGGLPPGSRLSLRKLGRSLGVSTAPVSEALRRLEFEGLVEAEPGWGSRVARFDSVQMRDQLVLRTALECETARQAARSIRPQQLEELRTLAEDLDALIAQRHAPEEAQELDTSFHLGIARAAGIPSLTNLLETNSLRLFLARANQIAASDTPQLARVTHLNIVESIATGDPDSAGNAMRQHCEDSMRAQLNFPWTSQ